MAQNITELGFNLAEFDAQTQHVIANYLKVYEAQKGIAGNTILPGSTGGWTELKKAADNHVQVMQQVSTANTQATQAITQNTQSVNAATKTLEQNIQARIALQNRLQQSISLEKEEIALRKSGIITQEELNKRKAQHQILQEKLSAQISVLNKEIKEEVTQTGKQIGPYKLLNDEYLKAQTNAKNLAVRYGIESKEAKAAAASALTLNAELKAIDASVGQNNRNVGNYAGSLGGYFNKILQPLRTLANIIPGLGIGGLVLFAVEPLIAAFKWITASTGEAKELAEQKKIIADLDKVTAENAGKEIADLRILKSTIEDANIPMATRLQSIKDLKEEYPSYFDGLSNEELLTGKVASAYDRASEAILKKARANAAAAEIEKLEAQKIALDLKTFEAYNQSLEDKANIKAPARVNARSERAGQITATVEDLKASVDLQFNIIRDANAKEIAEMTKKQKYLTDSVKAGAEARTKIDDPEKVKSTKVTKEKTRELLDWEFEEYKRQQQRMIGLLDAGAADTKKSQDERILLAQQSQDATIELINRTAEKEIAKNKGKNDIIKDIQNKRSFDILALEDKFQKAFTQINVDEAAKREKVYREAKESLKNVLAESTLAIDADKTVQLASLEDRFAKGLILQKDYEKQKAQIVNDSLILTLEAQKKEFEGERDLMILRGESTVNIDNAIKKKQAEISIAKNKTEIGVDKNKTEIDVDKLAFDEKKKLNDLIKQDAEQAFIFTTDLIKRKYELELNAIQKQIDANNKLKETEIANINQSTISAQEKAAQIAQIEAATAANNERLTREQHAIKVKEAKFDRDAQILKIIGETAYQILKKGVTTPQAIAIGVFGALQIASLLAKPIPQYAEGTENHPGGAAIVGEGKYKELVTPAGGKPFIADRAMLLNNLPKGSKVKPLTGDSINQAMYSAMLEYTAGAIRDNTAQKVSELTEATKEGSRLLLSAINKQKGANVTVNINGGWSDYLNKNVIN